MRHDVHHVRASYAGRIVKRGIFEAPVLETIDLLLGEGDHVVLGAPGNRVGRARLYACRLEPDLDSIDAHVALVDFVGLSAEARNVEGAARDAELAADAMIWIEIDDAVFVLNDGARSWAGV